MWSYNPEEASCIDMTSLTKAFYTLSDDSYQGLNTTQIKFTKFMSVYSRRVLMVEGIECVVSESYTVINEFLRSRGFDIQLAPFTGWGVAAVSELFLKWVGALNTEVNSLTYNGVSYKSSCLVGEGVNVYSVDGYPYPLAELETQTGRSLFITKADVPLSGLELGYEVFRLNELTRVADYSFDGVVFPHLSLNLQPNLSELVGIRSGHLIIKQIAQQVLLKLDDEGCIIRVATAASGVLGGEPRNLTFGCPMYMWVNDVVTGLPLVAVYVTPEHGIQV